MFRENKVYYDAIGRKWRVEQSLEYLDTPLLLVKTDKKYNPKYAIAIVERDTKLKTATILLKDGFTTIYSDEVAR